MSIQIPKGDNFGWGMPQARRTIIQGGDDPVGQTLLRSGRDLGALAININKEQQQKQEQEKNSMDRVAMANNAMDYQKEINLIIKDANDKVNAGKLQPEQIKDYVSSSLNKVDLSKYTPPNLNESNQALFNLHLKELDNSAGIQAERLQEKGIGQKAKTTINQYINNANEAAMPPDQFMASTKSDDFKRTASLVWGISAPEQIDNINRKYTVDYLQNQAIAASDKGDYKALRQLKVNVNNPDFYKGVLQQDDRVRLSNSARVGLEQIDSRNKRLQAEARQAVNEQYRALRNSLLIELDNGKSFDELDPNKVAFIKEHNFSDYVALKSNGLVKHDDLNKFQEITYKIDNGQNVDIIKEGAGKLTSSTMRSLISKQEKLKANPQDADRLVSRSTEFSAMALESGVSKDDIKKPAFIKISNEMNQEIEDAKKKKGGALTLSEERNIMLKNFAKVKADKQSSMLTGWVNTMTFGYFGNDTHAYYELPKDQRNSYSVKSIDDIPADSVEIIKREFKRQGNKNITNEDIVNKYNQYLRSN